MIPKIICWLFGHKRYFRSLVNVHGRDEYKYIPLKHCWRCAKPLDQE